MSDQADSLREWVRSRTAGSLGTTETAVATENAISPVLSIDRVFEASERILERDEPPSQRNSATRSIVFASGKGGVGTSNLTLNLAIALGKLGRRVLVIDADLGLANLDLLCSLNPPYDLGDVIAGRCLLEEVIVSGPGSIRIVPGAHGIRTGVEELAGAPERLADDLKELESTADFVLVDLGSGLGRALSSLLAAADDVVVTTTPEPTSLADAHALIRRFRRLPTPPNLRAVVTQTRTASEGIEVLDRLSASSRQFLGVVVSPLGPGTVRYDATVPQAVRRGHPFIELYPNGLAARSIRRLARSLIREERNRRNSRRSGFFTALAARWMLGKVAW
jgi:flagellar biosynthesis protein FlhG